VAQIYAGIFVPLAFLTSLMHAVMHGGGAESALFSAWLSLLAFSAAGYVVGWIAGRTVDQSVSDRISAQVEAEERQEVVQPT
jgi:hypothetical protein